MEDCNSILNTVRRAFPDVSACDAEQTAPLTLAYIGDTIYDLYVRTYLICETSLTVRGLHGKAIKSVCAGAQAQGFARVESMLTDKEHSVYKRGRNAHTSVPKNAKSADYHIATGFEALIGYLYLSGQDDRLSHIMQTALENNK